ncbi:threonine/serine exporter family protein [Shewanella sp. OMA3-2]|uniref:threonine/serine exporter family protein n=1 Tax=Shewanella sp. OMA3-2 TaxID=2908650 RepID=UPI001F457E3C|nr:threonine/serine exporter family protein [Shewanella sp. OMA3-2]UJF22986.1 threonine/serine exporter family protein [Shewanella sp. OMA3-2]
MYADNQNDITRLVVRSAQLLLAYGAVSDLIEELSQRLGKALGLVSVELTILSNALVFTSLARIQPNTFPVKVVTPVIGLSCASLYHLLAGDKIACLVACIVSSIGKSVRQFLTKRQFNLLVSFSITAFITNTAAIIHMLAETYVSNTVTARTQLTPQNQISPELSEQVTVSGFEMVFIVAAVAVGIALPSLVYYRNRPII